MHRTPGRHHLYPTSKRDTWLRGSGPVPSCLLFDFFIFQTASWELRHEQTPTAGGLGLDLGTSSPLKYPYRSIFLSWTETIHRIESLVTPCAIRDGSWEHRVGFGLVCIMHLRIRYKFKGSTPKSKNSNKTRIYTKGSRSKSSNRVFESKGFSSLTSMQSLLCVTIVLWFYFPFLFSLTGHTRISFHVFIVFNHD